MNRAGRFFRFCLSTWWAAPLGAVAAPIAAAGGFIGLVMVRAVVSLAGLGVTDAEATVWMAVWWAFFAVGAGAALFFAGLSVAAVLLALKRRQWRLAASVAGACALFPGLIAFALWLGPRPEDVYPGLHSGETDAAGVETPAAEDGHDAAEIGR
jgi:hypothetical protein